MSWTFGEIGGVIFLIIILICVLGGRLQAALASSASGASYGRAGNAGRAGFVPVRAGCSGGAARSPIEYGVNDVDVRLTAEDCARAFPHEPTVRDGTVAPLTRDDVPNMVARGLGAGSAGVAEYMREDGADETGVSRLLWFRAMADRLAGRAARERPANPAYQLSPGQAGALIPESLMSDRPLSLQAWPNLAAGYADGGDSPTGYDADFVTDGPYGDANL